VAGTAVCNSQFTTLCQRGKTRRFQCGCRQSVSGEWLKAINAQKSKRENERCSHVPSKATTPSKQSVATSSRWLAVCKLELWKEMGITRPVNALCPSGAKSTAADLRIKTLEGLKELAYHKAIKPKGDTSRKSVWIAAILKHQLDKEKAGMRESGSAALANLQRPATTVEFHRHIKNMINLQEHHLDKVQFKWLVKPAVTMPGKSCGSVFVRSVSVCNIGPFVFSTCNVKGSPTPMRVGCGCHGEFIRGETYGMLTDTGKNPDCAVKFGEKDAQSRDKCQHHSYTACGLDVYDKCMELIIPKIHKSIIQQNNMKKAMHYERKGMDEKYAATFKNFGKKIKKGQIEVHKLHEKLEHPARWRKYFKFAKIPMIRLRGTTIETEHDEGSCEQSCGANPACKSFSFNKKKSSCTWSPETFRYNPDFDLYLKPEEPAQTTRFFQIPGMMYDNPDLTTKVSRTKIECKTNCYFDKSCKMYSHSKDGLTCILGGRDLAYNEDYNYYEKEPIAGAELDEIEAAKNSPLKKQTTKMEKASKQVVKSVHVSSVKLNKWEKIFDKNKKAEKHYRKALKAVQKSPPAYDERGQGLLVPHAEKSN